MSAARAGLALLALLAPGVLLAAGGCEKVTGVDDLRIVRLEDAGTTEGGKPRRCILEDAGPCGACLEENCCDSALACRDDPKCDGCLPASSATSCPGGGEAFSSYLDCAQRSCASVCSQ